MGDGDMSAHVVSRAVVLAGLGLLVAAAASLSGLWAALSVAGLGLVLFGLFMIDVPTESE